MTVLKNPSNTPRPYISWSQYSLFLRSKEQYKKVYIYGEEFDNKYMVLGRRVAEILEKDEADNLTTAHIKNFIPMCPKREYEIKVDFQGVSLYGKLDQFNPRTKALRETKTGKKWTQARADKHEQLDFYALLVYAKYGVLPSKIHLDWAETQENDGSVALTGRVENFTTKRTMADVLRIANKIKVVWEGIKKLTAEEYAKI